MKRLTLLFCFILILKGSVFASVYPIYVNINVIGGSNDGTSWENAYTSLQDALDHASGGSVIWVAQGTYKPTYIINEDDPRTACFQMKEGVEIYGGFEGGETSSKYSDWVAHPTILSGNIGDPGSNADNCYHVIYNRSGLSITNAAVLDGFVIRDGMANDPGIPNNKYGGGICNELASPTISNCAFIHNNASGSGGGICNVGSSPVIANCIFKYNSAPGGGGAIYYDSPVSGTSTVTNCLFVRNNASYLGGAIFSTDSSPLLLMNCTFNSNSAAIQGGAIYSIGGLTVKNSIFWGDYDSDDFSVLEISTDNPSAVTYSCIQGGSGTFTDASNIFTDPLFVDANGTDDIFGTDYDNLALQNGSKCIGKATPTGAPAYDLFWSERNASVLDMGAIENALLYPFFYVKTAASGTGDGSSWTNARSELQTLLEDIGRSALYASEVWVAKGTYRPSSSGNRWISFKMPPSVKIYGGFAGNESEVSERSNYGLGEANETTLSGDLLTGNFSEHVIVNLGPLDNTAVLDGFTIRDGNALGGGPDPFAMRGSGICNAVSSNPTIQNCTFFNNAAIMNGGAIYNEQSSPLIQNCIFINNSATVMGCGGGVANANLSQPTIKNCTFSYNWAGMTGGALYNDGTSSPIMVVNTIFWGDYIAADPGAIQEISGGDQTKFTYCCIQGENNTTYTGAGNIFTDPLFVNADGADDTYGTSDDNLRLQNTSPCKGTGDAALATPEDFYGLVRGVYPCIGALENNDSDPMPVELTSLTASTLSNGVELKWETATEQNNYGFEIERKSPTAKAASPFIKGGLEVGSWEKIGFVNGSGNSNSPKEYSYIDNNPTSGNIQYRLKQIDLDGNYKYYSQLAEVNFSTTDVKEKQIPTEFGLSQNYPNPFNPTTTISYSIPENPLLRGARGVSVTLKVYDMLGNEVSTLVNETKAPGYYNVTFSAGSCGNAGNLSTGVYIYRITAGNFTSTKKLMLMK